MMFQINYYYYYYYHFTALWILSRTTRVSWYQMKHSPTHTYHGHQSFLICFLHLLWSMISSMFNFMCQTVFFHNLSLSPSFLWSTSWPSTLHFILHTFLHPIIVFFSQQINILHIPLSYQCNYRHHTPDPVWCCPVASHFQLAHCLQHTPIMGKHDVIHIT